MPFSVRDVRMRLRLIAGVVTALLAIAGGAKALASYSDYAPSTRGFARYVAKRAVADALAPIGIDQSVVNARIASLQRDSVETRLQVNQVRLEALRTEKFNRDMQLKATSDPSSRQLLQQRLDQISDGLDEVKKERERLTVSSP